MQNVRAGLNNSTVIEDVKENIAIFQAVLPIYLQDWWLDCCCGAGNWKKDYYIENGVIYAVFPYYMETKWGFKRIIQPRLVPYCGPFFYFKNEIPERKKVGIQHKAIEQFMHIVSDYDFYLQKWPLEHQNALGAYWSGALLRQRYTYLLPIEDKEMVFKNFRKGIKSDIKKAQKNLTISASNDGNIIFDFVVSTYSRQGVNKVFVERKKTVALVKALTEKGCGQIWLAKEGETIHAAILVAWDDHKAYYLLGGANNEFRNSGSLSFLLWHAIQELQHKVKVLDFEGSMIKGIEYYFRGFGGKLTPYLQVEQCNNWWYQKLTSIRS